MLIDTDVCVIGGGPAGAAAAIRLRHLGYRVCLVERQTVRRRVTAEALPDVVAPLLADLGLHALLERMAPLPCRHTRVRWSNVEQRRSASTFLIDRGRFDGALLDAARLAGVTILSPMRARKQPQEGGRWAVAAESNQGRALVRARFLVEAAGRSAGQTRLGPRTAAMIGRWRGAALPAAPEMLIEAAERSWLWSAPLADESYAAVCFVDPLQCAGLDSTARRKLYEELTQRTAVGAALVRAQIVGEICVRDATCRVAAGPATPNSIKVGDCAFAMDPLSSQGVQAALQSATQASAVAHTILSGGDAEAGIIFYDEVQWDAVRRHRRATAQIYASQSAFSSPFWRERSAGATAPSPPATDRAPLAPIDRLRLCPAARLQDLPAIDGTMIRRKLSLSHPALERPVTWHSGVELAPLLARLGPGTTFSSLLADWSCDMPATAARTLLAWLTERGILIEDRRPHD